MQKKINRLLMAVLACTSGIAIATSDINVDMTTHVHPSTFEEDGTTLILSEEDRNAECLFEERELTKSQPIALEEVQATVRLNSFEEEKTFADQSVGGKIVIWAALGQKNYNLTTLIQVKNDARALEKFSRSYLRSQLHLDEKPVKVQKTVVHQKVLKKEEAMDRLTRRIDAEVTREMDGEDVNYVFRSKVLSIDPDNGQLQVHEKTGENSYPKYQTITIPQAERLPKTETPSDVNYLAETTFYSSNKAAIDGLIEDLRQLHNAVFVDNGWLAAEASTKEVGGITFDSKKAMVKQIREFIQGRVQWGSVVLGESKTIGSELLAAVAAGNCKAVVINLEKKARTLFELYQGAEDLEETTVDDIITGIPAPDGESA